MGKRDKKKERQNNRKGDGKKQRDIERMRVKKKYQKQ